MGQSDSSMENNENNENGSDGGKTENSGLDRVLSDSSWKDIDGISGKQDNKTPQRLARERDTDSVDDEPSGLSTSADDVFSALSSWSSFASSFRTISIATKKSVPTVAAAMSTTQWQSTTSHGQNASGEKAYSVIATGQQQRDDNEEEEEAEVDQEAHVAAMDCHDYNHHMGDDDPLTYSDDSDALSDAYFYPQSDDELDMHKRLAHLTWHEPNQSHQTHQLNNLQHNYPQDIQAGARSQHLPHQNHNAPRQHQNYHNTLPLPPLAQYYVTHHPHVPQNMHHGSLSHGNQPYQASTYGTRTDSKNEEKSDDLIYLDRSAGPYPPQFLHHHFASIREEGSVVDESNSSSGNSSSNNNNKHKHSKASHNCSDRQYETEQTYLLPISSVPVNDASSVHLASTRQQRNHRKRHRYQPHDREMQLRQKREFRVLQIRGRVQDLTQWRDVAFAVIFIVHVLVVAFYAFHFGYQMHERQDSVEESTSISAILNDPDSDSLNDDELTRLFEWHLILRKHRIEEELTDFENILSIVGIAGFFCSLLTCLCFGVMLIMSRGLITSILIASILLTLCCSIPTIIIQPFGIESCIAVVPSLLLVAYTIYHWNRIPFAESNLNTAFFALRAMVGEVTLLGLGCLFVACAWCVLWTLTFIGIVHAVFTKSHNDDDDDDDGTILIPSVHNEYMNYKEVMIITMLLLMLGWTNTIITNVIRVTVASAIGTWWFRPGQVDSTENCCCPRFVWEPFVRATTRALGSICLGSLIVQPLQLVMAMGRSIGYLVCTRPRDCCLSHFPQLVRRHSFASDVMVAMTPTKQQHKHQLQSKRQNCDPCRYLRSYNSWAFAYVGLYGYGFHEAGERALELFETREWLEIMQDGLVSTVMSLASLILSVSTGAFAVVGEEVDGYAFTSAHRPIILAFLIGCFVGYMFSRMFFSGVVVGALQTVLICFAAAPFEFDRNHPVLSHEMRDVWSHQAWEPQHT